MSCVGKIKKNLLSKEVITMTKMKTLILISGCLLMGATTSFADRQSDIDNYAQIIQTFHQPKLEQIKAESFKDTGWFSGLRNTVRNGMRYVGDKFRLPDDKNTDLGQVTVSAKQMTCDFIQTKTGFAFTPKIFSAVGNAIRWIGNKVGTVEETKTVSRTLLNAANLHYTTNTADAEIELQKISAAMVKTQQKDDAFLKLLDDAKARGHELSNSVVAAHAIEITKSILNEKELVADEKTSKQRLTQRLADFLQRTGLASSFETVKEYVSKLYNKVVNAFKK